MNQIPRPGSAAAGWRHLSTVAGDLPVPNKGKQQTSCTVFDIDKDGRNDFVITERTRTPSVVWYRRGPAGWHRYIIDQTLLRPEAGAVFADVDGDGDLDFIAGGDSQSNEIWWWENPYPNFDPNVPWKRRCIKNSGATKHHDLIVGDFLGIGKDQLVFWNQEAAALYLAVIPDHPREAGPWECAPIFTYPTDREPPQLGTHPTWKRVNEHEGLAKADIDGDGKLEIIGGGTWFKHLGGMRFEPHLIDPSYVWSRCAVGHLIEGSKRPQVVLASGDGVAPLMLYEWMGGEEWAPKVLLDELDCGHSIDILDVDGDGNLDIFCAEMRLNGGNPDSKCRILYGDGRGNFRPSVIATGFGFHESKIADLDGDGILDIIAKPYNFETPRLDVFLCEAPPPPRKFAPGFQGPLGLEIYSLRAILTENVTTGLALTKAFGFHEVEVPGFYGRTALTFRALLDQHGLKCTAMVARYDRLRDDAEGVARDASILGASYIACGWIPHEGDFGEAECEHAAADFNRSGRILRGHGLTFCYHPHGFEFRRSGEGTVFDLLAQKTDPESVAFEADPFWIAHGGIDPVDLLRKYPDRFPLVHLKEMREGTPTGLTTGRAPNETSVAVGSGMLDYAAILRECARIGVKRYYIEDEAETAAEQIPHSVEFLKKVRF